MSDVTFTGFAQVEAFLAQITDKGLAQVTQSSALQIGHELVSAMQRYPGPSHSPVKWASKKQRAFYFAMRRAKGLPAKYTRISDPMSQKLKQSWGVVKRGITGAIAGNRALYGPLVQSDEHQTEQHRTTGWITDKGAVEQLESRNRIPKIFVGNLKKFVERAATRAGGTQERGTFL